MVTQTDIDTLHVEDILDVYLLDAMLARLGVEDANKNRVLRRYLDVRVAAVQDYQRARPELLKVAAEFQSRRTIFNQRLIAGEFDAAQIYLSVATGKNGAPSRHEMQVLQNLSVVFSGAIRATDDESLDESRAQLVRVLGQIPIVDLTTGRLAGASTTGESGTSGGTGNRRFGTYPDLIDQFRRFENKLAINPPPILTPGVDDPRPDPDSDDLIFG